MNRITAELSKLKQNTLPSVEVQYLESGTFVGGENEVFDAGIKFDEMCEVVKREDLASARNSQPRLIEAVERLLETLTTAYVWSEHINCPETCQCPNCSTVRAVAELLTGKEQEG